MRYSNRQFGKMNLNEVLETEITLIDLVSGNLDTSELLRLALVCKQYERFQAKGSRS
jgi:hypothetical protein